MFLMIRRLGHFLICFFAAVITVAAAIAQEQPVEPLSIRIADGTEYQFEVEAVRSEQDRARGLMFREFLAPDRGMLFLTRKEERQVMWMKNTLIPLDMVFIRRSGKISHLHERAVPGSEALISSRGRVLSVLELAGGTVSRLGIRIGDMVYHLALGSGPPMR